ncbi:SpoIIE family protein phosphatase [Streptomyces sp. WMMC500]|uniref:ATP-binding SpoIIE family protein phosphatase n=1 Tax=Streptomyces sp. WMMC500 TaxID=3015154 RepID=UPI00248AD3F2|nr:SpoIIE family protein phosphatase [Streptomyces sp. WMMC500]WBB61765.1 SpoIIE family protein phosphatase [Streptomyces sp. WMMC500]
MAKGSSFSFDRRGQVQGAKGHPVGTAVGRSAADAIRLLLDVSRRNDAPVIQFDAWQSDEETWISVTGTAASPGESRAETAYLASMFDNAIAGLELYDSELRVLRSNPAALAVRGAEADDVVDHRADELDPTLALSPLLVEATNADRVSGGCTVVQRDIRKGPRVFSVLALPLLDGATVIGAATIIHDVTDIDRSRQAEKLLGATYEAVGTTLGLTRTAQELASAAVEDFADVATVDLVESVLHGDEAPLPPLLSTTPLRRAAVASTVPEFTSLYEVGEQSHFEFPTPYTQVLRDLQSRLVDPHESPSDWHMHDAARAEGLRRASVHSLLITPLTQYGRVLGLVCLYRGRRHPNPFDRHDLPLAEQITDRAAVHLENARRYVRERTAATTLQRQLLPHDIPRLPAVSTAHFWKPGSRKTRWFDVISLSSARVGLTMMETPQHGLRASVDMGRFRTAFATLARMNLDPDELLAHLDDITRELHREDPQDAGAEPDTDTGGAATRCLYAVYDTVSGRCTIASADWPAPLATTPDGTTRPLDVPVGPPLGRHSVYEAVHLTLAPQTLLTCYSASMIRTVGGDDPFARLRRAAGRSPGDAQAACDNIVYALMGDPARRRRGGALLTAVLSRLPDASHVSWTVPRDRAAVANCRERVREELAAWGLDDQVFATEAVVSELVTNVLNHARGNPRIRMIRDDRLTVEVSDDSSAAPHLRHPRAQDEDGRGLLIAAALASRWGTRYDEEGKTVWVEQDLTPEDP